MKQYYWKPSSTIYLNLKQEQKESFPHERNDCAVKAFAAAAGIKYAEAHAILAQRGRKIGQGFRSEILLEELQKLNKNIKEVTSLVTPHTKTVRAFGARNYRGTYLIRTTGHILCSKNGIVQDWTQGRCHRILNVWCVDEKEVDAK